MVAETSKFVSEVVFIRSISKLRRCRQKVVVTLFGIICHFAYTLNSPKTIVEKKNIGGPPFPSTMLYLAGQRGGFSKVVLGF